MKIVTIVGARPQFIKLAPVSHALAAAGIVECVVDTGQHYDTAMSAVFFEELGMRRPTHELRVGSGSHADMTGRMLKGVEDVLVEERPDQALVFGDTNSTLAGALAAAKLGIPIIHVEAGLRSYRRTMPEEINRVLTDHLASVLFCPSDVAVENLRNEGIVDTAPPLRRRVAQVGDVMVDALRMFTDAAIRHDLVASLGRDQYVLATLHRAEATDDRAILDNLLSQLIAVSRKIPVILPLHPRTRVVLEKYGLSQRLAGAPDLHAIEPMGYRDFTNAIANARAVVTDSGGVQKEAFILGVPCITLRDETEWTETVTLGGNCLAGVAPKDLPTLVHAASPPPAAARDLYGDGRAAQKIAAILARK
ncbi:MAG: non-hydrolyzing UDP-N-acetylglucosamine 2-epimerase [Pseudolabrys sp.]